MKGLLNLSLVAMLALTAVVSSCGKYEEGSKFTLLTAKARMVNTWTFVKYEVNGFSQVIGDDTYTMTFEKDGKATITWISGGFSFSEVGTWEFNGDKTDLILKEADGDIDTFEIVLLKNKDLKLREVDAGFTYIRTFVGN